MHHKRQKYKTPDYHRDILRLPILLKMPFGKKKVILFLTSRKPKTFCTFPKFYYSWKKIHFKKCSTENSPPILFLKKQVSLFTYVFEKCSIFTSILRQVATMQRNNLRKKKFFLCEMFSDFEIEVFGLLSKTFRQGCKNCIVRVPKNVLRKRIFFEKKFFFFIFRN